VNLPSLLQHIAEHKRQEVAARRAAWPIPDVHDAPPPRGFAAALRRPTVALIAEVKQASPSRGVLRADFDPATLARYYEEGGAAALSVLTDERYFRGKNAHLRQAREATSLPVLRKEFILEPWQVAESRALGADAILLIAALLPDGLLRDLQAQAWGLGMDVLVEAHTEDEFERSLTSGARLVGINNRNLHTFETTLDTTLRLGPAVAAAAALGILVVSESGICNAGEVAAVARCGCRAVLVGEALVRDGNPAVRARELASVPIARQ
jgi:indole-3-glycerol phosphate synthase